MGPQGSTLCGRTVPPSLLQRWPRFGLHVPFCKNLLTNHHIFGIFGGLTGHHCPCDSPKPYRNWKNYGGLDLWQLCLVPPVLVTAFHPLTQARRPQGQRNVLLADSLGDGVKRDDPRFPRSYYRPHYQSYDRTKIGSSFVRQRDGSSLAAAVVRIFHTVIAATLSPLARRYAILSWHLLLPPLYKL